MSVSATSDHLNPAPGLDPGVDYQIPADAYWHLIRALRLALPPPPGDSPDDLRRRDHAAIAGIAALAPANAVEAEMAAQFVAASAQRKDWLRLAQLPDAGPERAAECRARAASMMRQANSALRLLLRLQEARRKLEADSAACNRAAWTEHCAIGLMAEALQQEAAAPERPQPDAPAHDELPEAAPCNPALPMAAEAPSVPPPPEPGEAEPSEAPAERVAIREQIGVPSGARAASGASDPRIKSGAGGTETGTLQPSFTSRTLALSASG